MPAKPLPIAYRVAVTALPDPPPGRDGWPWTVRRRALPATLPTGGRWPHITVEIPCPHDPDELEAAIRAVLAQDYPATTCVVIADGPTEACATVLSRYRPRPCSAPPRQAIGSATTSASDTADGLTAIIGRLAAGDILMPGALVHVALCMVGARALVGAVLQHRSGGGDRVLHGDPRPRRGREADCLSSASLWVRQVEAGACGWADENGPGDRHGDVAIDLLRSLAGDIAVTDVPLLRRRGSHGDAPTAGEDGSRPDPGEPLPAAAYRLWRRRPASGPGRAGGRR